MRSTNTLAHAPSARPLRAAPVVLLVLFLAVASACTKSPTSNETSGAAATSTAAPATTARASSGGTTETTRATRGSGGSTGSTRGGSSSSGSISTEGVCGSLTQDEIESATGETINSASTVRGGCSWDNRPSPVVQIEVDKPTGDAKVAWNTRKELYGSPESGNPGVGEDSVYSFDNEIYWLQGDTIYQMRVTGVKPDDKKQQVVTELAQKASARLPTG